MRTAVLLVLLLMAPSAWGCSCGGANLEEEFAASSAVFLGKILSEKKSNASGAERWNYQVQIQTVWKSDGKPLDVVVSPVQSGSCGTRLKPGHQYVIFASRYGAGLETISCNSTISLVFTLNCIEYRHQCDDHRARVTEIMDFLKTQEAH
jgi:hypothetical protein